MYVIIIIIIIIIIILKSVQKLFRPGSGLKSSGTLEPVVGTQSF